MQTEPVADPIVRQRYRFARDGDVLRAEIEVDPGGFGPDHLHERLTERWNVVEGEVIFRVGGREHRATPADATIVVEPGTRHEFANHSGAIARMVVEVEPALTMQEFLTEGAALSASGGITARQLPKSFGALLAAADLIERHRDSITLFSPPRILQRLLFPALARLQRRRRSQAAPISPARAG